MANVVFSQSLNIPAVKVGNLKRLVQILAPMFEKDRKYYFFCEKGAFFEPVTCRPYKYAIHCRSFHMRGGVVSDELIAFTDKPIR